MKVKHDALIKAAKDGHPVTSRVTAAMNATDRACYRGRFDQMHGNYVSNLAMQFSFRLLKENYAIQACGIGEHPESVVEAMIASVGDVNIIRLYGYRIETHSDVNKRLLSSRLKTHPIREVLPPLEYMFSATKVKRKDYEIHHEVASVLTGMLNGPKVDLCDLHALCDVMEERNDNNLTVMKQMLRWLDSDKVFFDVFAERMPEDKPSNAKTS